MLWPAIAGAMGWGIRGQFGHETGAMMAGLLVGLTLAVLWCSDWPMREAMRVAAFMAIGIGFGGSETYGQTIGLTQDTPLVGNWDAFSWGMLGLAIKGSIWIGFGGAFLGLALGGRSYRALEILALFAGMLLLFFLGGWLLNEPFDPSRKMLPKIYFSDDWHWEPEAVLKPRRERWGGLLLALLGLVAYLRWVRLDRLATRLAGWAMLGGALGFPAGQCLQAFHAWNRELFASGVWVRLDPLINWWNLMETTFGAVYGAVLGLGVWRNRHHLRPRETSESKPDTSRSLGALWEWVSIGVYVALLISWEFLDTPALNAWAEPGITMGLIPALGLAAGRLWPYWIVMPLTLIPIAGKTLRRLAFEEMAVEPSLGWFLFVALPVGGMCGLAIWARMREQRQKVFPARPQVRHILALVLCLNVWVYFLLNQAFFRWPWPWEPWTNRTLHGLIYFACALALTALAWKRAKTVVNDPLQTLS
jgi:hypothetical protein